MVSDIVEALSSLKDAYTEFLQGLIRAPSLRGGEAACQHIVEDKMVALGLEVSKVYSRDDAQSVNLAARIKGAGAGAGGRSLASTRTRTLPQWRVFGRVPLMMP